MQSICLAIQVSKMYYFDNREPSELNYFKPILLLSELWVDTFINTVFHFCLIKMWVSHSISERFSLNICKAVLSNILRVHVLLPVYTFFHSQTKLWLFKRFKIAYTNLWSLVIKTLEGWSEHYASIDVSIF